MRLSSFVYAMGTALSVVILLLGGVLTVAAPVGADEPGVVRVEGADRYATAAAAANRAYSAGVDTVLLATGERFPDALAANGLAGVHDAPILLTQRHALPDPTRAALGTLQPSSVVILGGSAAVSSEVEQELVESGHAVTRVEGIDRYATAAEAARSIGAAPLVDADEGAGPLRSAVLANGLDFPDAVSVSPALHRLGLPLLLTPPDLLDQRAGEALEALDVQQVLVVGGPAAVSDDVTDALRSDGMQVIRLAGTDRYATAVDVAQFALDHLGFVVSDTFLATGRAFPDALAAGPLASVFNGPLLLSGSLPASSAMFLRIHAPGIVTLHVMGGVAAIDAETVDAAQAAADPANAQLTVTPTDTISLTLAFEAGETASDDDRTYTVSGLDEGLAYDVALIPAANVTVAANGKVVFADDENAGAGDGRADGIGDQATDVATITAANGAPSWDDLVSDITATGTSFDFTIDGDSPGEVIPVVFADDGDDALELDSAGHPTVLFALGGETRYANPSTVSSTTSAGAMTLADGGATVAPAPAADDRIVSRDYDAG